MEALQSLKGYWDAVIFESPWTSKVIWFVSLGILFQLGWYAKRFISKRNLTTQPAKFTTEKAPQMEIAQLWVYPIKSIRGCRVSEATLTREGFTYDRKFMLLKVLEESPLKVKNMQVSKIPEMCLFHTSITGGKLTVTHRPPKSDKANEKTLEVPLEPFNFMKLKRLDIDMYGSRTKSYDMGAEYNAWFSDIFGYKVILAYWGGNPRPVLGNIPGQPSNVGPKTKNVITCILQYVPVIGTKFGSDDALIAFNDCAPYLVITEKSGADVTRLLPDGVEMDITKFRANIIVKGSPAAFDEDFWGELAFGDNARIQLTANCGRCVSLNVDYETGQSGTGRAGEVLKLMSKDRRVDPGMKYSPIFGRYGFATKTSEGKTLKVGSEVAVSRRNEERTKFYWPGLST